METPYMVKQGLKHNDPVLLARGVYAWVVEIWRIYTMVNINLRTTPPLLENALKDIEVMRRDAVVLQAQAYVRDKYFERLHSNWTSQSGEIWGSQDEYGDFVPHPFQEERAPQIDTELAKSVIERISKLPSPDELTDDMIANDVTSIWETE